MTIDECFEYVDQADECEGEMKAEYGMGAVSLGYDGGEAMMHYDGYRAGSDSTYVACKKRIDAYLHDRNLVKIIRWSPVRFDSIPF